MAVSVQEKPIEKIIASMLSKHRLVRIEFNATARIINARAIPDAQNPQVAVVRQRELEKAARASSGSMSLQEAQRITEDAVKSPIAFAYGDTFQEVLRALDRELKALK